MALPTLKQMVNEVLVRLREDEVSDVNETAYSRLIANLVNKTKREVEDSWNWQALRTTYEINTATSIFNYTLPESQTRFRVHSVWNTTADAELKQIPSDAMDRLFRQMGEVGSPRYYSFNGVNGDGDTQVDLYPIPNGAYEIEFQCTVPQKDLTGNDEEIYIPKDPVIEGALARAITERGEDGGTASALQWKFYKDCLSDHISIEANHFVDEMTWELR
jgi:hypothetical protein